VIKQVWATACALEVTNGKVNDTGLDSLTENHRRSTKSHAAFAVRMVKPKSRNGLYCVRQGKASHETEKTQNNPDPNQSA
jgi:hypothetical protein